MSAVTRAKFKKEGNKWFFNDRYRMPYNWRVHFSDGTIITLKQGIVAVGKYFSETQWPIPNPEVEQFFYFKAPVYPTIGEN
jgi:hypothetical protein